MILPSLALLLLLFSSISPAFGQSDYGTADDEYTCWRCPICGYETGPLSPEDLYYASLYPWTPCPVCHMAAAWQFYQVPCEEAGPYVDNETPQYWLEQGNTLFDQGDYQSAISSYQKATDLDEDYLDAWFNMGLAYEAMEDYEEAVRCFDEVLRIDPQDEEAIDSRERALQAMSAGRVITVGSEGRDYSKIQDAINSSEPEDTIEVYGGHYNESIRLDKKLTLRGVGSPAVDAGSQWSAIEILADGVELEGITVTNATVGIGLYSDKCTIKNITAYNNLRTGISLDGASLNTLSNNNASNNFLYGIELDNATDNWIINNTVKDNLDPELILMLVPDGYGVFLYISDNNTLRDNNLSDNNYGLCLLESHNNTLMGNDASFNFDTGFLLSNSNSNTITNNKASHNYFGHGFLLSESNSNNMMSNNASFNRETGIHLAGSNSNTIKSNKASYNYFGHGIYLENSSRNIITENQATNNGGSGINLTALCRENILSNNELIDNKEGDAWDSGTGNGWDDGSRGNFYSDFNCTDAQSDGICDYPHNISGNASIDRYPLAFPAKFSYVNRSKTTAEVSSVPGETLPASESNETAS